MLDTLDQTCVARPLKPQRGPEAHREMLAENASTALQLSTVLVSRVGLCAHLIGQRCSQQAHAPLYMSTCAEQGVENDVGWMTGRAGDPRRPWITDEKDR